MAQNREKSRKRNLRWLLAGLGGLFLACCACVAALAVLSPSEKPTRVQGTATTTPAAPQAQARETATATALPSTSTFTPTPELPPPAPSPTSTPVPTPYIEVSATTNVREGPGTGYAVVDQLPAGTTASVIGRNPSGEWLVVRLPDGRPGWVAAWVVEVHNDLSGLPVMQPLPTSTPLPSPTSTSTPTHTPPTSTPALPTATPTPLPPTSTPAPSAPSVPVIVVSTIHFRGSDEYVVVVNQGGSAQDMSGWRLQSHSPKASCPPVEDQVFRFPDGYVLAPGASVRIHSGPEAFSNPPSDLLWTDDYIWNNKGDKATLTDLTGAVVSTFAYGACR